MMPLIWMLTALLLNFGILAVVKYANFAIVNVNAVLAAFGSADANHNWNEFAVFNASSGGTMLNRKVSSQGTKASGQTWTLDLAITIS